MAGGRLGVAGGLEIFRQADGGELVDRRLQQVVAGGVGVVEVEHELVERHAVDQAVVVVVAPALTVQQTLEGEGRHACLGSLGSEAVVDGIAKVAAGPVGEDQGGPAGLGRVTRGQGQGETDIFDCVQARARRSDLDLSTMASIGSFALLEDRCSDAALVLGEGWLGGAAATHRTFLGGEPRHATAWRVASGSARVPVFDRERPSMHRCPRGRQDLSLRCGGEDSCPDDLVLGDRSVVGGTVEVGPQRREA